MPINERDTLPEEIRQSMMIEDGKSILNRILDWYKAMPLPIVGKR